jgi:hypothetical protein
MRSISFAARENDVLQSLLDDGRIDRLPRGGIVKGKHCVIFICDEASLEIKRKVDAQGSKLT